MDMRFGDFGRALGADEPAPIDFHAFVAALAASQAASRTARAAAAAHAIALRQADEVTANQAAGSLRRGAFNRRVAGLLAVQPSASMLKRSFTLRFQPSFKAHG